MLLHCTDKLRINEDEETDLSEATPVKTGKLQLKVISGGKE